MTKKTKPSPTLLFKALLTCLLAIGLTTATTYSQYPGPQEHFGFEPGEDRMLLNYESLMEYVMQVFRLTDKLHVEQIGESEMGKPIYAVFISSAENIQRLDELKLINRELAMNGDLTQQEQDILVENGKAFVFFTLSMHSTEVGPSQAVPAIIYELLTATDRRTQLMLNNTVCVLVPSHNPDGMNMIVDHYNKYKDTPFEGSSMPGVYHKYVGHNINRDFIRLTQKENKAIATFYNTEWFPQVMVEKHQMGSYGPRYFVSPPHDPIAENIDAELWNWMRVFGSRALTDMTREGLKGVSVSYLFDDYWPGATTTSIWKGVIGMLSEAASVGLASPIYIEPNEFRTIGKGLGEYAKSINMPEPWPGGWWRLSDIIEYERSNTMSYLHTAAIHKDEILRYRNEYTRREIERGKTQPPYYYILPFDQHDQSELVSLVNLMDEHGVYTYRLTAGMQLENRSFQPGDVVIPLAQPYRAFIKEMMENQKFPARYYTPDGEMIRPYEVTSWSLPLHNGVEAVEINTHSDKLDDILAQIITPFKLEANIPQQYTHMLFTANHNESYKAAFMAAAQGIEVRRTNEAFDFERKTFPAGSFLIQAGKTSEDLAIQLDVSPVFIQNEQLPESEILKIPRIALVESWFHAMDAGWLRFLLDTHQLPYTVLRPDELQDAKLDQRFEVVIITDEAKSALMEGKFGREGSMSASRYPPEYSKGMQKKGFENIVNFIDGGGTVLSWGRSVDLFTGILSIGDGDDKKEFQLPFRNIGSDLSKKGLRVTGAALRMELRQDHPLTYGMPAETAVFHRGSPVFATTIPYFDMDRRVIGFFAEDNILMSGYADNEKELAGQAALVWIKKGKGQLILYSFSPHHRSQTAATYKLLWNAILMN
ncbi:MAG TPA: hypothetical protein ENN08_02335 [Bacteroidales bacterium]|nr:hypothetical protein [Bacteroidales bacterium]